VNLLLLTSSFPAHPDDGRAAAGLFIADLARLLADDGHQVIVATPDKHGDKAAWPGFTVQWLPWPGGDRPLAEINLADPRQWPALTALLWRTPRQLAALCRRERIEAVIALWAVPAGWWARHLKRTLGLPFVTWCLGSDIWSFGRMPVLRTAVVWVLHASDAIYADGIGLAREVESLGGRPCAFLPSSRRLDPSLAQPIEVAHRPLFFFVGRYAAAKGADVLLDAMALYLRKGGAGSLVMRGGGPMEAAVRARAAQPDLRDRVQIGGYADVAEVVSYLAACDAQIIPSRRESIPVAYSDGLQMGCPLIVTDVGDMGDLMRRQKAGIIVRPEDPAALAEAMLSIQATGASVYRDAVAAAARELDLRASARQLVQALAQGAAR